MNPALIPLGVLAAIVVVFLLLPGWKSSVSWFVAMVVGLAFAGFQAQPTDCGHVSGCPGAGGQLVMGFVYGVAWFGLIGLGVAKAFMLASRSPRDNQG